MADNPQIPSPSRGQRSSSLKTTYLVLYNFVSSILWSTVLGRVLLIAAIHGTSEVYSGVGNFTKWTQTLALAEVLHAAFGIVRAPLLTTLMQVASRFLLVWGIVDTFPHTTSRSPVYSSMLLAWSVTEIIRYSYFAVNLSTGQVPRFLTWLRYNTFFVLYPLGISSECWLVYKAIQPAKRRNAIWELVCSVYAYDGAEEENYARNQGGAGGGQETMSVANACSSKKRKSLHKSSVAESINLGDSLRKYVKISFKCLKLALAQNI
ncbi:hypothetical protein MBLNU459_g3260t1 [Dothideomycetes sp. NU459]